MLVAAIANKPTSPATQLRVVITLFRRCVSTHPGFRGSPQLGQEFASEEMRLRHEGHAIIAIVVTSENLRHTITTFLENRMFRDLSKQHLVAPHDAGLLD